jgi:hypothetical protein|tara:strand:+ start:251 stop:586 length:336 start_codon:yes stop_codon:yes gene_type:complete
MSEQKLNKDFLKLQVDWQKTVEKFLRKSFLMNSKFDKNVIPGMGETMLFGLMWHIIKAKMKKLYPDKEHLNAELEFTRAMFKKILNENYPSELFDAQTDEEIIQDKKITIN